MFKKQLSWIMIFCLSLLMLPSSVAGASSSVAKPAVQNWLSDTGGTNISVNKNSDGSDIIVTATGVPSGAAYSVRLTTQQNANGFTTSIVLKVNGVTQSTGTITRGPGNSGSGTFTDLVDPLASTVSYSSTSISGNRVTFSGTWSDINHISQSMTFTIDADSKQCTGPDCNHTTTPVAGHILAVAGPCAANPGSIQCIICILICLVKFIICVPMRGITQCYIEYLPCIAACF